MKLKAHADTQMTFTVREHINDTHSTPRHINDTHSTSEDSNDDVF